MFVLDELDELLKGLIPQRHRKSTGSARNQLKVSLKDVERINVEELDLGSKVRYLPVETREEDTNLVIDREGENFFATNNNNNQSPTTDSLFLHAALRLILRPLSKMPDRHYPWAKLIVCDQAGHHILLKVSQLLDKGAASSGSNFIYKSPFKATAVLLLDDIVKLVGELGAKPIVSRSADKWSAKQSLSFNYSLIRQVFPCIKMSDIILLVSRRLLEAPARRDQTQILQYIGHYSRSLQLVEVEPVFRELGKPHLIYDNVLLMGPLDTSTEQHQQPVQMQMRRMSLEQLSRLAARLVQVASRLRLSLQSVTYRAGDLTGQSRVFSQLLAGASTTSKKDAGAASQVDLRPARVLVLDRGQDMLGPLLHADLYGPFVEQEMAHKRSKLGHQAPPDKLDQRLQLCRLTEVLGELLRYSMELKSNQPTAGAGKPATDERNAAGAIQSLRRHLNRIELSYRRLNEGYLLILRLELSLTSVHQQLSRLLRREDKKASQLSEQQHEQLADKFERILEAFNRLVELASSSSSVRVADLIRVACVMVHVCNLYHTTQLQQQQQQQHPPGPTKASKRCHHTLGAVREYLLNGTGSQLIKAAAATPGELALARRALQAFDGLSRESCAANRAGFGTLSPVELVESFAKEQLEPSSFPTINLAAPAASQATVSAGCCTIVTFLGQLSSLELARMKALEASLRYVSGSGGTASSHGSEQAAAASTGDMYILLAGSLVKPDQLLETLQ